MLDPALNKEDISEGDVIALGDIHATWKPYEDFLNWVKGSEATVVLLGDLIDRGGDDLKTLNATKTLIEDPEAWGLHSFHVLMGNHEKMFLESFADWGDGLEIFFQSATQWFSNGGSRENAEEMARDHYEWISKLPYLLTIGDTIFVHGGIWPGVDPRGRSSREAASLLWMREPFLRLGPKLGAWTTKYKRVVHGHTPTFLERGHWSFSPVNLVDRVNIDTGCCFSGEEGEGRLTAYNVTKGTFKQFFK
jgi:diadenosine tetraphosphatase ApaH/serine/threonine PP2A family protein phosphatase